MSFNTTRLTEQRSVLEVGVIKGGFSSTDLKVKAASNIDGDEQKLTGQKTHSVAEI
ncbi:hypothetical protein ACG1BZ_14735 [Microbulbifer sp. CNSA002]|uniref:hypothetical protein n=1 Tax=Microbulbifer sp. CNSA002 TaxID=3373604 RepID=UPI0039B4E516